MIQAHARFIEGTRSRSPLMSHDRHRYACRMEQVTALEAPAAELVYRNEAHHVLPPTGRSVAIRDRQFDVRDSL